MPRHYRPAIGLIGAGGISEYHLRAYRKMGLDVVAICDLDVNRAQSRRQEFYPHAEITDDFQQVLNRRDVEVVDVATHPGERVPIIRQAIEAGKHVLSQKPFVTDLADGRRLVEMADQAGVKLAVNQNGRWAPHFSYMREVVNQGLLGTLASIDFCLQWDHTWTADTVFNEIHHLILYDFAVHWFDMAAALIGDCVAEHVFAAVRRTKDQVGRPPFLAHAVVSYPNAQVRFSFNADTRLGQEDRTIVAGRDGTIRAWGPGFNEQQLELWTAAGYARPKLEGSWFDNGFRGTMGELLTSIEQDREPMNSARDNLRSLQLCFAAIASADQELPVCPASIDRLGG